MLSYSLPVPKKKPFEPKTKTWRPTEADARLFAELKAKLGVVNDSDVVRMGLRKLAEAVLPSERKAAS